MWRHPYLLPPDLDGDLQTIKKQFFHPISFLYLYILFLSSLIKVSKGTHRTYSDKLELFPIEKLVQYEYERLINYGIIDRAGFR